MSFQDDIRKNNLLRKGGLTGGFLSKGKAAAIGEERVHGGIKVKKTAQGWVPIGKGREAGKEKAPASKSKGEAKPKEGGQPKPNTQGYSKKKHEANSEKAYGKKPATDGPKGAVEAPTVGTHEVAQLTHLKSIIDEDPMKAAEIFAALSPEAQAIVPQDVANKLISSSHAAPEDNTPSYDDLGKKEGEKKEVKPIERVPNDDKSDEQLTEDVRDLLRDQPDYSVPDVAEALSADRDQIGEIMNDLEAERDLIDEYGKMGKMFLDNFDMEYEPYFRDFMYENPDKHNLKPHQEQSFAMAFEDYVEEEQNMQAEKEQHAKEAKEAKKKEREADTVAANKAAEESAKDMAKQKEKSESGRNKKKPEGMSHTEKVMKLKGIADDIGYESLIDKHADTTIDNLPDIDDYIGAWLDSGGIDEEYLTPEKLKEDIIDFATKLVDDGRYR